MPDYQNTMVCCMKISGWHYFVLVLLLISVMAAGWRWFREQRATSLARDACESLSACNLLIQLVREMQQHRGMSTAWLSGDPSFLPRLQEKHQQITRIMPLIKKAARNEGLHDRAGLTANQFSLFVFRWQCLLDELSTLTTEQNIARHTQSITRVLEWLAVLGEARIEPRVLEMEDRGMPVIGTARNYSRRLPQLTECLGQARAIGSSVAARRVCSPVYRVRLMFLISRAESLLEQAVMAQATGDLEGHCRQSIGFLAQTVRTRMLLSSGVVVSATEYFEISTRAIEEVFSWVERCGVEVSSALACGKADSLPETNLEMSKIE